MMHPEAAQRLYQLELRREQERLQVRERALRRRGTCSFAWWCVVP